MQYLMLVVALLFASGSGAEKPGYLAAHFDNTSHTIDLTPHILIFHDVQNRYTIESLLDSNNIPYRSLQETGKSFGFDPNQLWLKFTLFVNRDIEEQLLIHFDYPMIDEINLFDFDDAGQLRQIKVTGDRFPFAQRDIRFRNYLFHIDQQPGTFKTYYMRLQTEGSLQVALSVWSTSSLIEYADKSGLAYGFYYGVMIILMFAAAVAYLQLRDFLFLSYALYLASFLLFQMSLNGFSFQYLWPDLNGWVNRLNAISIGLVAVCGFIFCGTFLKVWERRGYFMHLYNLFIATGLAGILLSLFGNTAVAVKMVSAAGILLPPVVIISNIAAVMAGYRPARFFLVAWGIFLAGVFIAGLLYFGAVERNFFTIYAMQIASLIEIMILGYVLMDHVRKLTIEKQAALLSARNSLETLNKGLESMVAERTRELSAKNTQLSELALHDSMTGLLNHNTIIEHLDRMSKTARRYGHNLAVVMLDIDHFKAINDQFGHPAGDSVITAIAEVLKSSIRASDSCGRYGGEEFILLLPETSAENAHELASVIRKKITQIKLNDIENRSVSASFGITVFNPDHPYADLIRGADAALYQAKENGRNQVVLNTDSIGFASAY